MIDPDNFFKRDKKVDDRILNSVMESFYFPKAGDYFRYRAATIADRSGMGCIWLCIGSQDHAVIGRRVLSTYMGLRAGGSLCEIGEVRSFVSGDVIFYDCSAMWAALQADQSAVKAASGEGESR